MGQIYLMDNPLRPEHIKPRLLGHRGTTPFDICVMNRIDRYDLAIDVIDRVPRLRTVGAHARDRLRNRLIEHRQFVRTHGEDLPEIRNWQWSGASGPTTSGADPLREPESG